MIKGRRDENYCRLNNFYILTGLQTTNTITVGPRFILKNVTPFYERRMRWFMKNVEGNIGKNIRFYGLKTKSRHFIVSRSQVICTIGLYFARFLPFQKKKKKG